MSTLDSFNTFLRDRLVVVAEEIFQAVQDVFSEQQDELIRAKAEVSFLRRVLSEASLHKETDAPSSHPEEPDDDPQTMQNDTLNSESSLIQVKLELCGVPENETPQLLSTTSECSSSSSAKITDVQNITPPLPPKPKVNGDIKLNSYISINLKPCDAQLRSNSLNLSAGKNETASVHQVEGVKKECFSTCQYCNASFDDFFKLASHMERHKNEENPFQCQICGRNFKHRVTWRNHMIVHQKLRPFRCKFCSKGFNQKGHLKEHERIHTGEKPFGCSVCGKRFTQFNHVRGHLRNHHSDKLQTLEPKNND